MINALHGILSRPSAVAITAEYQAYLDRLTALGYALPSSGRQAKDNTLVANLKAGGYWNQLVGLRLFNAETANQATVNLRNPSAFQATLVNSPVHTPNVGITGNGISSYINTNFNPSMDASIITLNAASYGVWVAATSGTGYGLGQDTSTFTRLQISNSASHRIHRSANMAVNFDMTGAGFKHIERTSSTDFTLHNNSSSTSFTGAADSMNATLTYLKANTSYGAHTVAMGWAGTVLADAGFKQIISDYIASI